MLLRPADPCVAEVLVIQLGARAMEANEGRDGRGAAAALSGVRLAARFGAHEKLQGEPREGAAANWTRDD